MKVLLKSMPWAGRFPPLALRATPSGTGSTRPAHGTPPRKAPARTLLGLKPSPGSSPPRQPLI